MEIKMLSGALGAEVLGIDLKDSSLENWNKINNLLLEHKALFFRDQNITSEEQINLAKRFGPLERHIYVKGRKNYPEILRIIKEPDEKRQWGETWHTDVSYNPKPTKVIILRSLKIPPVGGDTMFSNMEIAYETLDEKIKSKIRDKKAVHSSLGAAAFTEAYKAMEGNGNLDEYSNAHPIVRTHPETGKKILYVNSMYTKKILDTDAQESEDILNQIFVLKYPHFLVRQYLKFFWYTLNLRIEFYYLFQDALSQWGEYLSILSDFHCPPSFYNFQ